MPSCFLQPLRHLRATDLQTKLAEDDVTCLKQSESLPGIITDLKAVYSNISILLLEFELQCRKLEVARTISQVAVSNSVPHGDSANTYEITSCFRCSSEICTPYGCKIGLLCDNCNSRGCVIEFSAPLRMLDSQNIIKVYSRT